MDQRSSRTESIMRLNRLWNIHKFVLEKNYESKKSKDMKAGELIDLSEGTC